MLTKMTTKDQSSIDMKIDNLISAVITFGNKNIQRQHGFDENNRSYERVSYRPVG